MVLKTTSIPTTPLEQPEKVGEVRLDHEGKGYFHRFDKETVVVEIDEVEIEVAEAPVEEPVKKPKKSKSKKSKK